VARGHGGARPNSGPKKGAIYRKTVDKLLAREELRRIVIDNLGPMVEAQVAASRGLKYLVTRDRKTGKFIRVTEAMARVKQDSDKEEIIEVWEKDPSTHAFDSLVNQAIDAPARQVAVTGQDGGPFTIKIDKSW
jgi:hypothetical protein